VNALVNPTVIRDSVLQEQLNLLASIEPTDVGFLSCYLDLHQGKQKALADFAAMQEAVRQDLSESERVDFAHALKMTADIIETLPAETRSVAIFCRGILGGQFFLSLPLAVQMNSHLSFDRVPDLLPLVNLSLEQGQYLVATVTQSWMQLLQVDLGVVSEKSWSTLPRRIETDEFSYHLSSNSGTRSRRSPLVTQIGLLEQSLSSHPDACLVLNCDQFIFSQVRAGLPERFRDRLVTLPQWIDNSDQYQLLEHSLQAVNMYRLKQAGSMAGQVLGRIGSSGDAVVGIEASLEVLHGGLAKTLVLVNNPGADDSAVVPGNPANAFAEVLRLAIVNHVPVFLLPANHELGRLGGVGCIISNDVIAAQMAARQYHGPLDLVA